MSVTAAVISLAALFALHQYQSIRMIRPKVHITKAWPESKNRDMKLYVQPDKITTIHEPENICSNVGYRKVFLLVVVNSAYNHFALRQNVRDTWGFPSSAIRSVVKKKSKVQNNYNKKIKRTKKANDKKEVLNSRFNETDNATDNNENLNNKYTLNSVYYRVIFVLGLPEYGQVEYQTSINYEAATYGDILQESFIDSYYNLSIKSTMMLKWVTRKCDDRVRYILKTDDDVIMSMQTVLNTLQNKAKRFDTDYSISYEHKSEEYVLLGETRCNLLATRLQNNKWYCPEYLYQEDVYPCFLGGKGYSFSMPAAHALYNAALKTPLFPLEDVYITGICRENTVPYLEATYDMQIAYAIHET